jgi:cell wall-associated NlpC family hydrolase
MPSNDDVVACARSFLGVRYRHQGRSREHGIDCIGLLVMVARELELVPHDFDVNGYPRMPDGTLFDLLGAHLAAGGDVTLAGSVLAMEFGGEPHHTGIASDIGVIHVYAQVRRCVEHRLDARWLARVRGSFIFPGVAYG